MNLLGAEGVDDGGLAHVGVADETNGDVLLVRAQARQLAQQAQQAALAEGVGDGSVEGQGWVERRQILQPPLSHPGRHLLAGKAAA